MQIAPAPADSAQADSSEAEEEVPVPPNILNSTSNTAPPDTTAGAPRDSTAGAPRDSTAGAARDSSGISLPVQPARPETLRYVPPGEAGAASPGGAVVPKVEKKRSGLFGLGPLVIILGLVAVHVLVVSKVGD